MEEFIDVLNPDGSFSGKSYSRTEVHQKGLLHRTVHIWAFDASGNILFQRRSFEKENNPGLLDTSCAGHISAGKKSAESAIRELSEELSVQKQESDLEYLFESSHYSILNGGVYIDNEFYDVYKILLSENEIQNLEPQKGEVDSFVWLSKKEFKERLENFPEDFVSHPKDFEWLLQE